MKQRTLTQQKIDGLVSFMKSQMKRRKSLKTVSGFMTRPYIPNKEPKTSTDQLDFKIL